MTDHTAEDQELASKVLDRCRQFGYRLATAESCTGGLIAAALTDIAGSSDVFDRGFVTYSNAAKTALLGVDERLIERDGAVSETIARAMAQGALERASVEIAISVTGIAGPDGGSADKPVGLVHIACARTGQPTTHQRHLFADGTRHKIRSLSVDAALALALSALQRGLTA